MLKCEDSGWTNNQDMADIFDRETKRKSSFILDGHGSHRICKDHQSS